MKHTGFWRQLAAILIDQLVVMLPSMIVSGTYYYVAAAGGLDPVVAAGNRDLIFIILLAALSAVYYVYLNGRCGVTLGRLLFKLKLTRLDEPNRDGIGYARAAARFALFALAGGFVTVAAFPGVPAALGIIIDAATGATVLWLLIDARRRTLEDKIMGTFLVYDPLGKFLNLDPDKLPPAKIRQYSFTALVVINALASVYSSLNR
jgi:RDD family.